MHKTKMIPLESILKDIFFLIRDEDVDEDMMMEFAIRALEHLSIYKTYDYAVCFLEVANYQAAFPQGLLGVEQVMYLPDNYINNSNRVIVTDTYNVIAQLTDGVTSSIQEQLVFKIPDYNQLPKTLHKTGWQYLPLSNRNFDRSIICNPEIVECNQCSQWWYPDSVRDRFIVSFESGLIAVTYYRYPQDEKGRYMIIDNPFVKDAIESFILSKYYQRQYNMSVDGAESKYRHYTQKWEMLANAAVGDMMMPSIPEIINIARIGGLFERRGIRSILGGYGGEHTNMR